MHLLPGISAWSLINIPTVYREELRLTGISGRYFQYSLFILVSFSWYLLLPFLILHFHDGLSWKECRGFLGLDRIDACGLFIVLPIYCVLFAIVALPYMRYAWNPLSRWCQSVPAFNMPSYTIFKGGRDGLYAFPPTALLFMFVG